MDDAQFPLVVDRPREIEDLGSTPLLTALARAALTGLSGAWLGFLAGWMLSRRDIGAGGVPALVAMTVMAALSLVGYFLQARQLKGERFTFWSDRFERSGGGAEWLMRYGEIATVRFASRSRVDIVTREGQPRVIRHLVFSFMQRLQELGAPVLAQRLRQTEIEAGRAVVLREPLGFAALGVLWLARMVVLSSLVWFVCATYLARASRTPPFDASRGLVTVGIGAVVTLAVLRLGERRVSITAEGVRRGGRTLAWSDVERVTSDMHGIVIRAKDKGGACRVSWHATNAFVLPPLLGALVKSGTRVDRSEWASPWQLLGADPVSFELPDYD